MKVRKTKNVLMTRDIQQGGGCDAWEPVRNVVAIDVFCSVYSDPMVERD